jgi:predicted HicB family RNase H-like nuclease
MAGQGKKPKTYKMPKEYLKGTARRRGEPIMYDEVKEKWNLNITPTAKRLITEAAKLQNFSASEFIERWARTELIKIEEINSLSEV